LPSRKDVGHHTKEWFFCVQMESKLENSVLDFYLAKKEMLLKKKLVLTVNVLFVKDENLQAFVPFLNT
jgi:uncharacterized membrane protein (UPF0182 family)